MIAGRVYPCARLTTGDVWIIDEDGEQVRVSEGDLFLDGSTLGVGLIGAVVVLIGLLS